MENLQTFFETAQRLVLEYGLNVIGAILILAIGLWVAGRISNLAEGGLQRVQVTPALRSFAGSLVKYGIIIFTVIAALQTVGVPTTSFVAVLGAAGLAIGLALEGALSNFAAGVLILFFRPFRIGDLVEVAGNFGKVEDIQIFNSVIVSLDNKTIIIPNGQITSDVIVNYSRKGIIRLDMSYGIGYGDDLLKAKKVLQDILENHEAVLEEPKPVVAVAELGDSSVNFTARPYVNISDFIWVQFDLNEQVKLRFDEEGIEMPFPQRDVHLFKAEA